MNQFIIDSVVLALICIIMWYLGYQYRKWENIQDD